MDLGSIYHAVFPAQKIYIETIKRIKKITRQIAKELNITGPFNIQFLAKDKGIKLEILKYFKSGFELSTWITFTDKIDIVNSKRYFDKGFSFRIPLDLFMNKSSRKRFNFKMSEWLRDVGAKSQTGKELYMIIHDERNAY